MIHTTSSTRRCWKQLLYQPSNLPLQVSRLMNIDWKELKWQKVSKKVLTGHWVVIAAHWRIAQDQHHANQVSDCKNLTNSAQSWSRTTERYLIPSQTSLINFFAKIVNCFLSCLTIFAKSYIINVFWVLNTPLYHRKMERFHWFTGHRI